MKTAMLWMTLFVVPAFGCQECLMYEVSSASGRAVSVKDEPIIAAKVRFRKAIERSGDRPHVLSCLYSFDKGRVVRSTKTDRQGRFEFGSLPPGNYWIAIKTAHAQIVRIIKVDENLSRSTEPIIFQTSESGFTGDQCDVLQAKDFM